MSSTDKPPLDDGPLKGRVQKNLELARSAVAGMWLCLLTYLKQHKVQVVGECNIALVALVRTEVLAVYNDTLALSLDCQGGPPSWRSVRFNGAARAFNCTDASITL